MSSLAINCGLAVGLNIMGDRRFWNIASIL